MLILGGEYSNSPFFLRQPQGFIMVSYTLRLLILLTFALSFNALNASEQHFDDGESDAGSDHAKSQARFEAPQNPRDDDAEDTPTEIGQGATPNATCAHKTGAENSPPEALQTKPSPYKEVVPSEADGFISVEKQARIPATLQIKGGMFDTLSLPNSSMPYTEIMLLNCTCFGPLDPSQFQNNPELRILSLTGSQLNLRHFEEKLGEKCANLSQINLQGFTDVSAEGQTMITPERFAQLAHPDILQRILSGQCTLFISHPEGDNECYGIDEMKEKFLSSILQLRSLRKAEETVSTYQRIVEMLKTGVGSIDPSALASSGVRAAINACTGI